MSVTLINRTRRCLTFNLPHNSVCAEGECLCSAPPLTHAQAHESLRLARSLTLLAGQALTAQPSSILKAPEVQRAIKRGALLVEPEESEVDEPERKGAEVSEPEPQSRARRKKTAQKKTTAQKTSKATTQPKRKTANTSTKKAKASPSRKAKAKPTRPTTQERGESS